jgi:hypothetical protein
MLEEEVAAVEMANQEEQLDLEVAVQEETILEQQTPVVEEVEVVIVILEVVGVQELLL